jgi:hypothetical protein
MIDVRTKQIVAALEDVHGQDVESENERSRPLTVPADGN